MPQTLSMDQPSIYRIEVQGHIDERWAGRLQGMTLKIRNVGGIVPQTIITLEGVVADQAAMRGLLRNLYNLGFQLLSVTRLEPSFDLPAR